MMINSTKHYTEKIPAKFIFDIDTKEQINSIDLQDSYINELYEHVFKALYEVYLLSCDFFLEILDSSGEYTNFNGSHKCKTSFHVVF